MDALDTAGIALKATSFKVVKALGGEKNAGFFLGQSHQVIQRKADKHCAERWFNLREVAELEAHAPEPLLTRLLCHLAGGTFVPLLSGACDDSALSGKIMEIVAEVGDVSRKIGEGLAGDGELDADECRDSLAEQAQLETRVAELRMLLERRLAAVSPLSAVNRGAAA